MGSTLVTGTGVGFSAGLSLQASVLSEFPLISVDYGSSGFDTGRPLSGSGDGVRSGFPLAILGDDDGFGEFDFSDGGLEIAFEVRGVADNGLEFSGRIVIGADPAPLSQAEKNEALPGADSDRALSNFALLLFTDEAPSDGGDDFFDFIGAFGPRAADGSGPGTGLRGADGERVQSLLNELGYDPPESPSDTRLSGGALYSGDFPSDGDIVIRTNGVADNGLEYGVNLDFGNLESGASAGGPIVKDKTHFFLSYERLEGETSAGPLEGVAYQVDFGPAIGQFQQALQSPANPFGGALLLDRIDLQLTDAQRLSARVAFEYPQSPTGGPADLIAADFALPGAEGGPIQGTATLFQAPAGQGVQLAPLLLPVRTTTIGGATLSAATAEALGELGAPQGATAGFLEYQPTHLRGRAMAGSAALLQGGPALAPNSMAANSVIGTAQAQPNGGAASMLFGGDSGRGVGGIGVASNGVQFSGTLEPSVLSGNQVGGGAAPARPLVSGDAGARALDAEASRFFLDAFVVDPGGRSGTAAAGAPAPAPTGPAPAAQPGRASGEIRIGGGVSVPAQPGGLRMNVIGQGVAPNGPTYGVRINLDPAQTPPARPGVTAPLGVANTTIRNNTVSANFSVDVRGAEQMAERACGGAGLNCGGGVRDVTFSFNRPGGAPIVDVTIGVDAAGQPAARGVQPGGLLILTLAPNGVGPQASAKLFQVAPDGPARGGLRLVDVAPPVAIESNNLQDAAAQAMGGALRSVAPGGRLAVDLSPVASPSPRGVAMPPPRLQ